ncbi:hypothetical protein BgAZ_304270 [Babesia gibsoni]|uniref:RAP domain-containing protein n=1 Tax=Babesia gibsoni TaxID=33632 RepID=A0AAD8PDK4_BABGI|nr:hypothetical protein BgAZ_304270 [Babesia gibsoni]
MAILRAREHIIARAARHEARIKRIGVRIHKRFRSWTQQRTRKFWMPMKVSLHSPVDLMDGWLISAAVQKAATIRKHDISLWHSFARRVLELSPLLNGQQIGYIYYGFGKSRFLNEDFYKELSTRIEPVLASLGSSSLMCVVWALNRLQIRHLPFLSKVSSLVAEKIEEIRVSDLIKICNSLTRLDVCVPAYQKAVSENMVRRLDTIYAQDFRNAMNAVTIVNLYDDQVQKYIMERFSKTFICARPQHLHQALAAAVALRTLHPLVWKNLDKSAISFYTRLSMRKLHLPLHKPSLFHWDVSSSLAELGIAHRNSFHWGCYWIDIGEVEERTNCWFVDGPCCFYTGTTEYTNKIRLEHRVLENLGWNIRRVTWFNWVDVMDNAKDKVDFLRQLRNSEPLGEFLPKSYDLEPSEIRMKLKRIRKLVC